MSQLDKLIEISNEKYDGMFTMFKFEDRYHVCFGMLSWDDMHGDYYDMVDRMSIGKSMENAIDKCIKDDINIEKMKEEAKEQSLWDAVDIVKDEILSLENKCKEIEGSNNDGSNASKELVRFIKVRLEAMSFLLNEIDCADSIDHLVDDRELCSSIEILENWLTPESEENEDIDWAIKIIKNRGREILA